MKLPKEIQRKIKGKMTKKKNIPNISLLIKAFKEQFSQTMLVFNDNRELEYIYESDKLFAQTAILSRYSVRWNRDKIRIIVNKDGIRELSKILSTLVSNVNLKDLHKQIANHEYGHVLSAETAYELYPDEAKKRPLFELTPEQLLLMHYSPLEDELNQVSIDRLIGAFSEFYANYLVKEKIDPETPYEILKDKEGNILEVIEQVERKKKFTLSSFEKKLSVMDKGFDLFFLILERSNQFFIFDKWEKFCSIFRGKNLGNSLKLMKIIYKLFINIIQVNNDVRSMFIDIIELAKYLDQLNFAEITLNNIFSDSDKHIVRGFNSPLKNK